MVKEKSIVSFIILICYACSPTPPKNIKYIDCRNISGHKKCEEKMISFKDLSKDEKNALNTVVEFYLWYCENNYSLNQDKFFSLHKEKGYYSYDLEYIEEYLDKFKRSGFVSDSFLNNL